MFTFLKRRPTLHPALQHESSVLGILVAVGGGEKTSMAPPLLEQLRLREGSETAGGAAVKP